PGADRDGLRWLAFELFSGHRSPSTKTALAAAVRASLPPALVDALIALAHDIRDQARFAEKSASWASAAGQHLASGMSASGDAQAFPWLNPSVEYVLRPQQLDADAAGAPPAVRGPARKSSEGGDSTYAAEELARSGTAGQGAYRIFTTAHD